jgi:serine phosphatase RsbU (regulator of sigma subunit)/DNA-binding response OmpR family regulator
MASVLVVDDDTASRHYLRALLTHRGHHVHEAPDGETALRMANQHRPAAIFTDVLMPGLDGCELARILRSQPPTATVPIVFNTAHYDRGEIQPLARACGVHHILRKPAKPATVLAVVDAVLTGGGHQAPQPVDAGWDFTEQHRTTMKAKLLQSTAALQSCQAREDRLRREVTRLRGMLAHTREATAAGVWRLDQHSGTVLLSATLVDRLGLPARLPRREFWQRVHPDDRPGLAAAARAARRTSEPQTTRLRFADTDGAVRDLAVTCRSADRRRLWGIAQDLTEVCHEQRQRVHTHALAQAHRLISDSWHAAMVPHKPPAPATLDLASAYLTAPRRTDTGADWYDTLPLPDGRILVSIGSVAGHRLPGPTVAGPMRAVLRAYALEQPDPAGLLARLNHYLISTTTDDTYMTALAALYDPETATLELANAGHPPPLLIRHDPATGIPAVHRLPTQDPPLGISHDAIYRTQRLALGPGTRLCAYTDGLTGAYLGRPPHDLGIVDIVTTALTTAPGRRTPAAQQILNRILTALLPVTAARDDIGLLILAPPS